MEILLPSRELIAPLIPHGLAAIGIDGIMEIDEKNLRAIGVKTVTKEDCGTGAHFDPAKGLPLIVPGTLLEEWGYQVGLVLLSRLSGCRCAMPEESRRRNISIANLGDRLIIETSLSSLSRRHGEGEIRINKQNGSLCMICQFSFGLITQSFIKRYYPPGS